MTMLRLKKGEDRRIRGGHPWVFSNEIDTTITPLKSFQPGQLVSVEAHDKSVLGSAYINPHSLIAARLYSRTPNTQLNQDFFLARFREALALRSRLYPKPYYRFVFGESDNVPGVIIDRFGKHFVIQINTAGMEQHKEAIVQALTHLFPDTTSILLRNDSPIREQEGLKTYVESAFGTPPDQATLEENNVQFYFPLQEGQKTGWFYDHRESRARLKNYVKDANVLDVFSYLGGWGIQAAVFGASKVDCIEASAFACDFIRKNAELNHVAERVEAHTADAFDALKALSQQNKQYDVIILDPPAFVKKSKDRKEGLIAYQRINEYALKLLTPNGILFSCSCSMHVTTEDFHQLLHRAAYRTQHSIQILERGHQAPDHPVHIAIPETDYLKTVIVRKTEKTREIQLRNTLR